MPNPNIFNIGFALCLTVLLAACSSSAPAFPPQTWEDVQIRIETRPPQLEKGMNEFLIIATRGKARPAHDLVVSLAINDMARWHQAIQDGHVGAYRRALRVTDPASDVLFVRIERDNRQGVLRLPLGKQQAPAE